MRDRLTPSLLIGLGGGFVLGFLASHLANLISERRLEARTRKRYEHLVGDYEVFGFEGDDANPLVRKTGAQGTARVEHVERNVLRMTVTHGNRIWEGQLAMEHEGFGGMVWRYPDYSGPEHAFGFKRLLATNRDGVVHLYTVGETPFGNELFVKREASQGTERS